VRAADFWNLFWKEKKQFFGVSKQMSGAIAANPNSWELESGNFNRISTLI
jgi:hypothetical protein